MGWNGSQVGLAFANIAIPSLVVATKKERLQIEQENAITEERQVMKATEDISSDNVGIVRPFFSIVMPSYNAATHLDTAVDAIQGQTFKDWELIIVDDCSTDDTREAALRRAEQDRRIRVVSHDVNKGCAGGRNTGMDIARGSWLWMPDSDDAFAPDLLQNVHDALHDSGAQLVIFGFIERYLDADGTFLYDNPKPLPDINWDDPEAWRPRIIDLEQGTQYGYAWNKIYNLDLLRSLDLHYEGTPLIEDVLFNIRVFDRIERIIALEGEPYIYFKKKGSSITNSNAFSAKDYYAVHRRRIQELRDQFEQWGVLDARVKSILGSLYARYILSTLERNCYAVPEGFGHADRVRWCKEAFNDPLFNELIPTAKASGSKALSLCLIPLRAKNVTLSLAMGRAIHLVHGGFYGAYTKMRSGR